MIINRLKYNNSRLLIVLYFILILSFAFVGKDLYVFQKIGFDYKFNWIKFLISFGTICGLVILFTIFNIKEFLYSILILVLVFFTLPSAILYIFIKNIDYRIFLSHTLLFLFTLFIGMIKVKPALFRIRIKTSYQLLFVLVILGMIPFIYIYLPHINLNNILLKEIYETRAIKLTISNNMYINYTYSWFSKVIIPIVLVLGIYFRHRMTIVISILCMLFLFLVGAHKVVFAGIFAVLILYKFDYYKKSNYILKVIITIGTLALFLSLVFDNNYLMTMSIRRIMFLPALLDTLYFDMFNNQYLLWSESFPGLFMNYPFELSHSYVIGEKYFGSQIWGANNGIISDGFMNFGMIGVIINILIFAIFFSVLNQLNINQRFFGVYFLLIISILSSSLLTVLLSHGGIVLLLISITILKNSKFLLKRRSKFNSGSI